MSESNPVVACTLGSGDLATRAARWRVLRDRSGLDRLETDEGLRLVFAAGPDVERELQALVALENECCSWASWDVAAGDGVVTMDARSSGDGIAVLHRMFLDF
jgi:hypothetical protein